MKLPELLTDVSDYPVDYIDLHHDKAKRVPNVATRRFHRENRTISKNLPSINAQKQCTKTVNRHKFCATTINGPGAAR
jgi:hypothetical protein